MRASALLLLMMFCALAAAAQAQDAIHHCVDAHGNPLFTDQPCSSQQATAVQTPAPSAGAAAPGAVVPLHRCATTTTGLRQQVIDAFAAHDPNKLAGLMLWRGYGDRSAVGDLRALTQLVRQPLLSIHFDDEPAIGTTIPAAPPLASALRLRTESGDDASFEVAHRAGCLWLRYED
jgi:hypothetical protein